MPIARRNQHPAPGQGVAVGGFRDGQGGSPVERFGEHPGEDRRHVLHDHDRRHVGGQGFDHAMERGRSSGGCADGDEPAAPLSGGSGLRGAAGPESGGAAFLRLHGQFGQVRGGGGLHLLRQIGEHLAEGGTVLGARLADDLHRSGLQGFQRPPGPFRGHRGNDDRRNRILRNQPLEELDPVHPRHLHVEGQHVRLEENDLVAGGIGVGSLAHNLYIRVKGQAALKKVPSDRGVVDDKHAGFLRAHGHRSHGLK